MINLEQGCEKFEVIRDEKVHNSNGMNQICDLYRTYLDSGMTEAEAKRCIRYVYKNQMQGEKTR